MWYELNISKLILGIYFHPIEHNSDGGYGDQFLGDMKSNTKQESYPILHMHHYLLSPLYTWVKSISSPDVFLFESGRKKGEVSKYRITRTTKHHKQHIKRVEKLALWDLQCHTGQCLRTSKADTKAVPVYCMHQNLGKESNKTTFTKGVKEDVTKLDSKEQMCKGRAGRKQFSDIFFLGALTPLEGSGSCVVMSLRWPCYSPLGMPLQGVDVTKGDTTS
jgi:hypothetical protein